MSFSPKTVTLIVGLPGSGKSCLLSTYEGLLLDDPRQIEEIKRVIGQPKIVIADSYLCLEHNRKSAEQLFAGYQIDWIFFENDPFACKENVKARMLKGDQRKVFGLIDILSPKYQIPPHGIIKPVWRG